MKDVKWGGGRGTCGLVLCVSAWQETKVKFAAEIISASDSDSFFVQIQGAGTAAAWHSGQYADFSWSATSPEVTAPAGESIVQIWGREKDIKVRTSCKFWNQKMQKSVEGFETLVLQLLQGNRWKSEKIICCSDEIHRVAPGEALQDCCGRSWLQVYLSSITNAQSICGIQEGEPNSTGGHVLDNIDRNSYMRGWTLACSEDKQWRLRGRQAWLLWIERPGRDQRGSANPHEYS